LRLDESFLQIRLNGLEFVSRSWSNPRHYDLSSIKKSRCQFILGLRIYSQFLFLGGRVEYCYLYPRTSLFRLPDKLPVEALVASGCAAPTMVHAAEKADIHVGHTVVVQGRGPVGLLGLVVARESGAGKVIVMGGPKERLQMAQQWGADATMDISEIKSPKDRIQFVKELSLSKNGADVVLECSGVPSAFAEGAQFARDGGKYIIVGQFMDAGPAENFHPFWITFKELTVKGSYS